jgi:hypothetical protein
MAEDRLTLQPLMGATIWDGEKFAIVDPEGAYSATAGSMSGLIPWIAVTPGWSIGGTE